MISEKEFSTHYGSFWRSTLPNLESVTRSLNLNTITEWDQINSNNDPNRRDIIAETAFTLASKKFSSSKEMMELLSEAESLAINNLYLLMRRKNIHDIPKLDSNERNEVLESALRMLRFAHILQREHGGVCFRPQYFGHGFLHACEGDLTCRNNIYEFKYVSRNFRSADFKQALIYTTLYWFKTQTIYKNIWLINPFRGVVVSVPTAELVSASGGGSFQDFCRGFSQFVSAGDISR